MMADDKLSSAKTRATNIPVPVATPSDRRSGRIQLIFKSASRLTLLLLSFCALRLWIVGRTTYSLDGKEKGPLVGRKAEDLFLSVPDEYSAMAASRRYASKPHRAGTEGDLATAKDFLALLQQELGILSPSTDPIFPAGSHASRNATLSIPKLNAPQAWIDVYYPLINSPLDRSLEIIGEDGQPAWKANLEEVSDATDPDAEKYADAVPAFHGLSVSGQAQGKLVYAHYGRQQDYAALLAKGVDLNGTIVITRYGGIFRGLKVKGAQELGAAAVLIYSDPRDDGTVTSANGYAPYPLGPARNPTSVQRGSVSFISMYPGDPTTPGYPSYENSSRTEGTNYPSIPSLPISWATAEVLLQEIGEGGSGREVKLVNNVDDKVTPIWNVMGVIPGHIQDEVVVVGNHRDSWVLGATDPSSGTVSVHEMIRGFGALLRTGWRPLRTVVFASWDAEEYALIGSTEWGEDFPDFIDKHVVAYLNLDSSTSGSRFGASASPSLSHLFRAAAEELSHPTDDGRTLWDARSDQGKLFGNSSNVDAEVLAMDEAKTQSADSIGVNPLGSGSDYTVFLQRIGVASANGGFSSTLHDPVYHYHSVFDSVRWQDLYGDPGFVRHVAVAKHLGLLALRLSGDIVLPLNTTHYTLELEAYLDKVEAIALSLSLEADFSPLRKSIRSLQAASLRLDAEKCHAEHNLRRIIKKWRNRRSKLAKLRRKARKLLCKLKKLFGRKGGCKPSHDQETELEETHLAVAFATQLGAHGQHGFHGGRGFPIRKFIKAAKRVQAVNKKLASFERGFISEEGIKDREWFKHLGVAPGKWLGYGATPLPAVEEALTLENNATSAEYEAGRLKVLLDKLEVKLLA